jgi:hypothetical protein
MSSYLMDKIIDKKNELGMQKFKINQQNRFLFISWKID